MWNIQVDNSLYRRNRDPSIPDLLHWTSLNAPRSHLFFSLKLPGLFSSISRKNNLQEAIFLSVWDHNDSSILRSYIREHSTPCFKCFTGINSFNLCNNLWRVILLLAPLYWLWHNEVTRHPLGHWVSKCSKVVICSYSVWLQSSSTWLLALLTLA